MMASSRVRKLLIGEWSWKRLVKSVLLIYGFLFIYGMFFAERIIFQPQPSSYQDGVWIEKLTTTDGVKISSRHYPNPKATYTLLYSHGNAEDLGDIQPMLEELVPMGFSVFAYDYHGYGTSGGKPTEANTYRDIDAAYEYLTGTLHVPPDRILVYGRSVGGGPTVDLASRKPVGGLILESPFLTAFRVLTRVPILPFDRFRNVSKIPSVKCPVLVMHGRKDRVISFFHGRTLFERANNPKRCLWVDDAGHDNVPWVAGPAYAKTLKEFVELVDASRGSKPEK